jgi:AcrR family transcriptional regulator
MTPQERSAQTRDAAILAGSELFAAKGYAATSSGDIAASLGRSKGSLTYHFPTKAELALAIVEEQYKLWAPMLAELQNEGHHGLDAMLRLTWSVAYNFQHNVVVRAAARLQLEAENVEADMPRPYVGWIQMTEVLAREAVERGEIVVPISIERLSWFFIGAFFGVQQISNTLEDRENVVSRVEDMWMLVLPGLGVKNPAEVIARTRLAE